MTLGDSGGLAINVALNPDLGYNPLKDFTPITALAKVPTVLVLNAAVPARTLDEFVRLAKSHPGQLSYGSAGFGSVHHLTMALFAKRAGINLLHVPYRGGTALVNDLLTGEIPGRVVRIAERGPADRKRQAVGALRPASCSGPPRCRMSRRAPNWDMTALISRP